MWLGAGRHTEPAGNSLSIGFALAAIATFVRIGYVHEILVVVTGIKLYLLYVFGMPALAAVVISGGIPRVFRGRPAFYWTAFALWITLAIPFSSWMGGSARVVSGYLKVGPAVLFTIAGLTITWRECKGMMWAFACAAIPSLAAGRFLDTIAGGRLMLDFGSIQNANDYAAHLLFLLPFLLWVVLGSRSLVLRLLALSGGGLGIYLILRTASRGAAVALLVGVAFFLWRGTTRQRIVLLGLAPVALAVLVAIVPQNAWDRIRALSASGGYSAISREAAASENMRRYLLEKSMTYALEHPFFGVGPGLFSDYEGGHERIIGTHGSYYVPHNTYTQVASECGFPALLLVVAGVVSTLRLLNSTYREARRRSDCQDIRLATFCVMLTVIIFCTAATFLSLAYTFYLPAMAGLAVAIGSAAKREFASRTPSGSATWTG